MLAHEGGITGILPDGVNGPTAIADDIEEYQQIDDAADRNPQRLIAILVEELDKGLLVEPDEQVVEVEDT